MPYYLTVAEIKTRMGETLIDNFLQITAPATADAELTEIINRQESVIHSYIGGRYTTPLTGTDGMGMAEEWAFKLSQYDIHERGAGDDVQIKVRMSKEDVMKELRDISTGRSTIPNESTPAAGSSITMESNDVQFDWGGDAEGTF